MMIETISGNETFSGGYETRVMLFFQKVGTDPAVPLFKASNGVQQVGSFNYMLACEANKNHGAWTTARYAVIEKCFITVSIGKKLPGDFIKHTKQLMLYCRAGAALQRIRIMFSGHPEATIDYGHIEGRFDIVPIEKFAELGIRVEPNLARHFDWADENPAEFYTVQVLEPEVQPMIPSKSETVITDKGKTVHVSRPRRRVFIGK